MANLQQFLPTKNCAISLNANGNMGLLLQQRTSNYISIGAMSYDSYFYEGKNSNGTGRGGSALKSVYREVTSINGDPGANGSITFIKVGKTVTITFYGVSATKSQKVCDVPDGYRPAYYCVTPVTVENADITVPRVGISSSGPMYFYANSGTTASIAGIITYNQ